MYHSRIQSEEVTALFEAILTLDSIEDCYRFFDDVCTIGEVQAMAQRLEVAKLLSAKVTYSAIVERTKASSATISRVNKCLLYGAEGYTTALARLQKAGKAAPVSTVPEE